jgi:hypothetical protein
VRQLAYLAHRPRESAGLRIRFESGYRNYLFKLCIFGMHFVIQKQKQ